MSEEAYPEAAAILRDAGWKPHDNWGVFTRGTLVMGFSPDGQHFDVKNWGLDVHGPETPDDPVEAAQWLVAFRAPALAQEPEAGEHPEHEGSAEAEQPADGADEPAATGFTASDGAWSAAEPAEFDPIDADFEAIQELGAQAELPETDFETLSLDVERETANSEAMRAMAEGPIAYGASTIDGLIREKLGRVSQIARELKAVLQEGWTVEEYAYLQNLMVRMDRGEAPDDQASRERFLAIAAKSQAMSRIDSVRDRKEGELEEIGQRRDFDAAVYYEPGEGWPE